MGTCLKGEGGIPGHGSGMKLFENEMKKWKFGQVFSSPQLNPEICHESIHRLMDRWGIPE